jgi:hypothetical protein
MLAKFQSLHYRNFMIATVINYCSHDYRFLSLCLREVESFSTQIVVPVCDHFFDGRVENRALLEHSYRENSNALFVEFAFDSENSYGIRSKMDKEDPDWIHYWHSTSRYVGFYHLDPSVEYVLFLDVDEITESNRFLQWLQTFPYQEFDAIRFTNFFYFRESKYRAVKPGRTALMVKRSSVEPEMILDPLERKGLFNSIVGKKIEDVYGIDGLPLFHHYSWVKTKEELFSKINWGHHKDRDWKALLEAEFSRPFQGKDSIWNEEYEEVISPHDPLSIAVPKEFSSQNEERIKNLLRVNRSDLFRLTLDRFL